LNPFSRRTLFKDLRFVLLLAGLAVALLYTTSSKGLCFFHFVLTFSDNLSSPSPLFVPPFFLPLYAESALGLSGTTASYIGASYNLASSAGRIGFGLFADALLGGFNSLVACLVLVSVSTLLIWPFATSLTPLCV
jgi:hypothetical protein